MMQSKRLCEKWQRTEKVARVQGAISIGDGCAYLPMPKINLCLMLTIKGINERKSSGQKNETRQRRLFGDT